MDNFLKTENFTNYLNYITENKEKYLVFIIAKDHIGRCLTNDIADRLLQLGITTDLAAQRGLNGKCWRGYTAVLEYGGVAYEKLAENYADLGSEYKKYKIFSSVYKLKRCDDAILINNDENWINYCANMRGINIIVFDKDENCISSVNYDTFGENPVFIDATKKILNIQLLYRELTNEKLNIRLQECNFHTPNAPWGETAVVFGCSFNNFTEFVKSHDLAMTPHKGGVIISTGHFNKYGDIGYVFNGMAFSRTSDGVRNFIVGEDDIRSLDINISNLYHEYGEFELLTIDDEVVELSKDYFGLAKWFYYHRNGVFAAATSFHMLILLLKNAEIKLELNSKNAVNYLAATNWITAHLYSYETFIKDIYYVPVDKYIRYIYNDDKLEFITTPFHNEQYDIGVWNETLYINTLDKAKIELIENMTAIFNHPRFTRIIVDATDGLDTRTNLAVLSMLPETLKNKARAYSIKSTRFQHGIDFISDFTTACGLTNLLGIPFIDIAQECRVLNFIKNYASCKLGQNFMDQSSVVDIELVYPDTIKLTGGNGESCSGSGCYGVFSYNDSQSWDVYYQPRPSSTNAAIATAHKNDLYGVLSSLPAQTLQSQLDLHYTHFRNSFHFGSKNIPQLIFSPIQSKYAYKAKKIMLAREGIPFYTCQHDLITLINPVVAAFPYISEKQIKRIKIGTPYRLVMSESFLTPDYNQNNYENTFSKNKVMHIPDKETFEKQRSVIRKQLVEAKLYDDTSIFMFLLKKVSEFIPIITPDVVRNLLKGTEGEAWQKKQTVNKLLHLYYLIHIINDE